MLFSAEVEITERYEMIHKLCHILFIKYLNFATLQFFVNPYYKRLRLRTSEYGIMLLVYTHFYE